MKTMMALAHEDLLRENRWQRDGLKRAGLNGSPAGAISRT